MFKNTASQSVTLSAYDSATGLQKTGDSANMVFYVDKDDAGPVAITAASGVPTEISSTNSKGDYKIALAQAETNADKCHFTGKSTTSGIVVLSKTIYTVPANFTKTSIDGNGRLDIININGQPQTARDIGASVLLAASQHVIVDSGTVTTLTNLPVVPTDWLTAAGVKADAVTKIQAGLSTYAGGDTAGTTTLLSRVTASVALASQIPANFTAATFVSAGVFSVGALANAPTGGGGGGTVTGYATGQDPGTLVLDALAASHNTTGTIGHAIGAAGGAADPLLNTVPGSYASGTAGYALGRIGSGQIVTTSPVAQSGNFTLVQGATYYAADGQSIDFTDASAGWPNLTGGSVQLRGYFGSQLYTHAGSLVTVGGSSQKVRFEFSATDTAGYALGSRPFDVLATLASGHTVLLVSVQGTINAL